MKDFGKVLKIYFIFLLLSCAESNIRTGTNIAVEDIREEKKNLKAKVTPRLLKKIELYKPIIKKYSKRYNLDWRLILSLITQESKFREKAVSRAGAKGLMQIMPGNKKYLSEELDIEYIYENPEENIRAGIFHLSEQIGYFKKVSDEKERLKIALASYNGGVGRIYDAMSVADYLYKESDNWESIKTSLRKLKPKYYELHLEIWMDGKPKYGYFYNHKETTQYVDSVLEYYNIYKQIFDEV
jgi:membrane-bound lytic murein transglycosylase F